MNIKISLILVVAVWICTAQTPESTILEIDKPLDVTQPAATNVYYSLTIPDNVTGDEDLFIFGQSPANDPFQEPYLEITSDNNYFLWCSIN
jgi:hypothetical protein